MRIDQLVHGLHFNNLKGDIYGGLTAAVVALPLALAMGVSSGAGPVAGLYGAIFVGFFAALFGGTPAQVSGPTGPMTVVMAAIFTHYTAMFVDNPAHGAAIAFTVVIMGGLLQIMFGVLRIGKYINLMPYPVVSGFMSGIGVIIILLQLGPLLGAVAQPGPLASLQTLPSAWANLSMIALVLGLLTLLVVYLLPKKIAQLIPSPLLALIVGTLALLAYGGTEIATGADGVARIADASILGNIPTGLPAFQMPTIEWNLFWKMIVSAFTLALLGSIDSLLTSLVADNITRTNHESNRELIGQGIGNTIAGFFGGLPGAGATMRTVVNVRAGGLTPISGALHAVVLLAIVLGAGAFAKYIPHAVLAGILIKVGTDIIDWDYLKKLHKVPTAGVLMMLVVMLATVFVDLITAVGIGMVMASFIFMQRMVDMQLDNINIYKNKSESAPLSDEAKEIMRKSEGDILLFCLKGPLSFGAARDMQKRLAMQENYEVLVLDFLDVSSVDFTSTMSLYEMIDAAIDNGRKVLVVGANQQVKHRMNAQGITALLEPDDFFEKRLPAMHVAEKVLENSERPVF